MIAAIWPPFCCTGARVALLTSLVIVAACDHESSELAERSTIPAVAVTVSDVALRDLELTELSSGHLQARSAPMIAAEVAGRISEVLVDVGDAVSPGDRLASIDQEDYRLKRSLAAADVERVRSLIKSQSLQVKRLRSLVLRQSINQSALDQAEAELGALSAQLTGALVQRQRAQRDLDKSQVSSPIAGSIDERHVSAGDFVNVGMPLFHVSTLDELQVRLPYPEALSSVLRRGLEVRLSSPAYPDMEVVGSVSQIRPVITPENRALSVIVDLPNPGGWEPGASVVGRVVIALRRNVLVVPDVAIVRRPAGLVVYVVDGSTVTARRVRTGVTHEGMVEVVDGLQSGDVVVQDGAAFLTDGARVDVVSP